MHYYNWSIVNCLIMEEKIISTDIEKTYDSLKKAGHNYFELMGNEIIKSIKTHGLGVLPKSDLEGLIFHCICTAIEGEYEDDIQKLDYVLMQMLRISTSKLRSLRVTRSAKYLGNLDYNDPNNQLRLVRALKHVSLGGDDIITSKIRISISDPHTQQLIERMIEDNNGILDCSFNPKLLVLNAKEFLGIIVQIYGEGNDDGYNKALAEIKTEMKELHNVLTKDNILDEFKGAFKEQALGKLADICIKIVTKAVKKELVLNKLYSPMFTTSLHGCSKHIEK